MDTTSMYEETSSIFEGSEQTIRSELALSSLPSTEASRVSSGDYAQFFPVVSVKESFNPISFNIIGDSIGYLDLFDSFLSLKCKLTLQDGKSLEPADVVAPDSLFFHAIFTSMEVHVNGQLLSSTQNLYPYQAIIKRLLCTSPLEKQSTLLNEFYHPNAANDSFVVGDEGFKVRHDKTKNSQHFTLLGKLDASIFCQTRYFPPDTSIWITLKRSLPEFCLTSALAKKTGFNGIP
ncbi:unnamed protein product, partial [Allacma fusca]